MLVGIWIVVGCTALPAQEPPPQPRSEYLGRQVAQTMHFAGAGWLIRHKREREESALEMRRALGLRPGLVVCDLGSGNGYHSLPMAQAVAPDGRVLAVDIQPEMLIMLKERADRQEIQNIDRIIGEGHDPHLPEASCDLVLMVDVYHEFSYPEPMLTAIRRALRPGGRVVLVEYREEDASVPIKPEHKMSKEQIIKEMRANGFVPAGSYDRLPWQHMMWFGREGDSADPAAPAPPEGADLGTAAREETAN